MKKILFCYSLLICLFAFAGFGTESFEFEKELDYEKKLEERINLSLSNFINPSDFILIVDVKLEPKKQAEKPKNKLGDIQEELSNLNLKLPGILQEDSNQTISSAPDSVANSRFSQSYDAGIYDNNLTSKISKILITLFLNKDVQEEKRELVQTIIVRTAQLDLNRGDELNIRTVDFSKDENVKTEKSKGLVTEEQAQLKENLPFFANDNNRMLFIILGCVLLLIVILLFMLLFKNKTLNIKYPEMQDKQYKEPDYIQLPPVTQKSEHTAKKAEKSSEDTSKQQSKPAGESKPATTIEVKANINEELIKKQNRDKMKQDVIHTVFSKPEFTAQVIKEMMNDEGGIRVIACLINTFGVDTARNIFDCLDSVTINKIFSYFTSVESWTEGEDESALIKFNTNLKNLSLQKIHEDKVEGPFGFVKKMSDEQIMFLIKGEEIPILALFLAHLPPQRSAKILGQFPMEQASAVAAEIGNLKYVNMDVISAVASKLSEKSMNIPKFDFYPGTGINCLVQIMDNLESGLEKGLIDKLKDFDSNVASELKKAYFVFDDILNVNKEQLKLITKEIPRNILATSLVGVSEGLLNKVLSILPERRAEMLKFDIEKQLNTSKSEIIKSQKAIVSKIREMIRAGGLDLEKLQQKSEIPAEPIKNSQELPDPVQKKPVAAQNGNTQTKPIQPSPTGAAQKQPVRNESVTNVAAKQPDSINKNIKKPAPQVQKTS